MPSLLPGLDTLASALTGRSAFNGNNGGVYSSGKPTTFDRTDIFQTWSVADEAKAKAKEIGNAAAKDFDKTSAAVQAKTGKIELYSGQYYAACTFGGMLACVCAHLGLEISSRTHVRRG